MSKNQYGLPLSSPSTQTVLPIVQPNGRVYGFYPITSTTFQGTETSFTLSDGAVPITTVTTPQLINMNVSDNQRVTQYMAAQWPISQEGQMPWRGHADLIRNDIPNTIGFYSWWSMPTVSIMKHFGNGTFLNSMKVNMAHYPYSASTPGALTVSTPQTLTWACTINMSALAAECAFFDFNWVSLFNTSLNPDATSVGNAIVPVALTVTGNPAGGIFKATLVQAQGGQTVYPGGGAVFNTVRILKLGDATAGTYTFNFNITDTNGGSVAAVLNLTVQ